MKPLRYAPIDYRIAMGAAGSWDVHGYAVDLPAPLDWLHICVRKSFGRWTIDHFETGIGITGPLLSPTGTYSKEDLAMAKCYQFATGTRASATRSAIKWLTYLDRGGMLRQRIERAIAGDLGATRAYRDEIVEATR